MDAMIGYISSFGGPGGGHGIEAQERELRRAFHAHGWELAEIIREPPESGDTLRRPGLRGALQAIADGQAAGLAVTELERLTYSLVDLGDVLQWLRDAGGRLVALELDVDSSRPDGQKVLDALLSVSEWQRRATSEKTKAGLEVARAKGKTIGRPAIAPELAERIRKLHTEEGWSLRRIADQLTAEGVPTARGAPRWTVSSVQRAAGYERPKRRQRPELPTLRADGQAAA